MKKRTFLSLFIIICTFKMYGQDLTVEELFKPKMPEKIDTLYYPFYNGVQMIEVDHIGFWDKKIFFLEQTEPRAMPHSMKHPSPTGNEFFFRDKTGTIIKSYSTDKSLADLTQHFRSIPLHKKGQLQHFFPYHSSKSSFSKGMWSYSPQSMYDFNGFYKVSGKTHTNELEKELKYGLIDSLGNIKLPMKFDEILPLKEYLLVSKNKKWGVINIEQKEFVPFEFEHFDQYYSDQTHNNIIFFQNKNKYSAIFFTNTKKFVRLNDYDEIRRNNNPNLIPVIKNGKMGFVNSEYKEVVPPQYEISEYRNNEGLFRVVKDGKFGFINRNAKEIIPCKYDYVEPFTEKDSVALVFSKGEFFCIDKNGKRLNNCDILPNWKYSSAELPDNFNWVETEFNRQTYRTIIDLVNNELVFPFNRTRFIGIGNKSEYFGYQSPFSQKIGIINLFNRKKTGEVYDYVGGLYENKIIVAKDGKFGVLDTNYNTILEFNYENLQFDINNSNYYLFRKNGFAGIINLSGKIIVPANKYTSIDSYLNYKLFRKDGKTGVLNTLGKEIIPNIYDEISSYGADDYLIVGILHRIVDVDGNEKYTRKYGIIDMKNNEILPVIYDRIFNAKSYGAGAKDGYFYVMKDDERLYIKREN